jgi:hypothetical protein
MSKLKWTPEHQKNYQALFNKITENNPKLNIDGYIFNLDAKKLLPMEAHIPCKCK